jgi:hypothetical protein
LLFDTGAGITAISPKLADALGCEPYGRLTAHRMSGERVDMPLCSGVELASGGLVLEPEVVGVFDIGALLPPDWPPLDGVVGLDSFHGRRVALDLACGRLTVSPSRPAFSGNETRIRASRPAQGLALDIHVEVPFEDGSFWFIADTGNTGPVIVAEHAAPHLGIEGPAANVTLPIDGFGAGQTEVVVRDIIRDGNLGAAYLASSRLLLDLDAMRMWVAPTKCPAGEG